MQVELGGYCRVRMWVSTSYIGAPPFSRDDRHCQTYDYDLD